MRYTHYRGLAQVSNWVRLKFAVMNLKKLTKWKFRSPAATVLALVFFPAKIYSNAYTGGQEPCARRITPRSVPW